MDTKICNKCFQQKNIEDFHFKNKPRRDSICKECKRKSIRINYEKNKAKYIAKSKQSRDKAREIINELKNRPCKDCGLTFPPICMDFDHINNDKEANVAHLVIRGNINMAIKEAEKCEIVCACCHRIRTHKRYSNNNFNT